MLSRAEKQEQGVCVRKRCWRDSEDGDFCPDHAAAQRIYNATYRSGKRAEWAARKLCTSCGMRAPVRGGKSCSACRIRNPRTRFGSVSEKVENSRKERIAKRLIPWSNSPHNEGRVRLRGGKRGAPSSEERDRRDLADIRRVLARYEESLAEAYSEDLRELTPDAKRAAREAAHAGLALAVRLGMEALVSYGYECPVLHPDEIGDSAE